MSYRVSTQVYSGPFDLLLQLVTRQKVDIGAISISEVAEQYLAEAERIEALDLDVASDFLLVAATLLDIKAASLVPQEAPSKVNDDDGEFDEDLEELSTLDGDALREVLIQRLIAYKQFKGAAAALGARMQAESRMHPRVAGPDPEFLGLMPDYLAGITLRGLAVICADLDGQRQTFLLEAEHVAPHRVPLDLTVASVDRFTMAHQTCTFRELLDGDATTEQLVVTFLAMLELAKRGSLTLSQDEIDPDPDVVVSPSPAQKLMTTADRLHALAQTGVDAVVAVPFTPEVAALDHVGFLALLSRVVDIRSIRVGSDFRLGRGGASGVAEMRAWGSERGVDVYGHDLLCEGGEAICATRIRHELGRGHVGLAAGLLGRPYMVRGGVIRGRHEGSGMGFPTANLQVPDGIQVPADGVYEGLVLVNDIVWPAAVNVGLPPTYADDAASAHLEANLIGYTGDLYGASVSLAFTRWLRPSRVFDSLDELIATVEGNIEDIRHNLGEQGVSVRD